jgi:hypothetical protein
LKRQVTMPVVFLLRTNHFRKRSFLDCDTGCNITENPEDSLYTEITTMLNLLKLETETNTWLRFIAQVRNLPLQAQRPLSLASRSLLYVSTANAS